MIWHDGCIASEAKCLGSKTVCSQAFEYIKEGNMKIISELVTDQQALQAVETFLGEVIPDTAVVRWRILEKF